MGNYNYDALTVADQALKTGRRIRFTQEDGKVFPSEQVTRIDGGPEGFEFRLSKEGARNLAEFDVASGDICYASFDDIVGAELVDD